MPSERLEISGVPHSLSVDGWWLAPGHDATDGRGNAGRTAPMLWQSGLAILAVVVLADVLFWSHKVGVSAALFAVAVFAVAMRHGKVRRWQRPAVLLVAAALPVVDHLQALSLGFLAIGLVAALVWAHHPEAPLTALLKSSAQFVTRLPAHWVACMTPRRLLAWRESVGASGFSFPRLVQNWAFPAGGGLVLAALLMEANPVLSGLLRLDVPLWDMLLRSAFWLGIAIAIAPFLVPPALATFAPLERTGGPRLGLHEGSVLRALMVFNLLIGIQSITDLSILLFGAELPPGLTFAEYAHRGAYPLLAAAILAGGFALAARPFLAGHWLVRPLLLIWITQNMVLCAAAALRLDLYVAAFSLTYLRLYAFIWIGLVAAWLGLLFSQVFLARTNSWLVLRGAGLGLATLYVCSLINVAEIIASHNLKRSDPDLSYLCGLGPMATAPILESGIGTLNHGRIDLGYCAVSVPRIEDWREWGFRSWRTIRYVQLTAEVEKPR
jgi:hypothetical protein